ncbi:PAS domain-containing sensor histidine kinase [Pedobacter sp. GR22-6]|uniref:PAS domain-containing sensor histidine kinase n=1 Tax=Pedobacter sp. GR22-6 TaxID=3127957 RepID=UPI00307CE605
MMKRNVTTDTFQRIGELAEDLYFIFDHIDRSFIYVGAAAEKVTGLSPGLYNTKLLFDSIHPDDRHYVHEAYQELLREGQVSGFEFRMRAPGQSLRYIQLKMYSISASEIAGIACDVTTNRKNILYAERINAKKNSSLEILTHDLKGSIGMIAMLTSAIHAGSPLTNQQKIIDSIKNICKRNVDFIRSVVTEEFSESAELELRKERFDVIREIRQVVENYQNASDLIKKQVTFLSNEKRIFMVADTLKLIQVVNNLISNAIKFTPDYGTISVQVEDQTEQVRIVVSDTGIGIPEELKPYVFEKYTRARREGLKGEETVGLGMSIIKKIVDLHEGQIWFESQANSGSTFYIMLPKRFS